MQLLFCCEFYHPSRGGAQEVMRQIAEHLVKVGHQVTVATTRLAEREFVSYNGVALEEFTASGNLINGLTGEVQRYQAFLKTFPADAILINAAQQWTFDAALPALDAISARKVCISCGFSGRYWPEFRSHFEQMPDFLRKFDHLIFHASNYRDIDFARQHKLSNYSIVPNGASEDEFLVPTQKNFRASLGIAEEDFLILTVGAPISSKGHAELAQAFALLPMQSGETASLILNGNWPLEKPIDAVDRSSTADRTNEDVRENSGSANAPVGLTVRRNYLRRAVEMWHEEGAVFTLRHTGRFLVYRSGQLIVQLVVRPWRRFRKNLHSPSKSVFGAVKLRRRRTPLPPQPIDESIAGAHTQGRKKVLKTSLSREDTVQAFLSADLFVFASNIEYSPLVLFEAAAAGTPFITVPVGNSPEIVQWTGGGVLCPAPIDEAGFTRVDPAVLARSIETMIRDAPLRRRLGEAGRRSFREKFYWRLIAKSYEKILSAPTTETIDKR
jgi:glycosyltransferase involved in cell wall biosynthesis